MAAGRRLANLRGACERPGSVTPPPHWLVRLAANPLLRLVLPSPLGARIPLGLLRVSGRRTGQRYTIPAGLHDIDGAIVVFTDARWLGNFRGGADAELMLRGGRTVKVVVNGRGARG